MADEGCVRPVDTGSQELAPPLTRVVCRVRRGAATAVTVGVLVARFFGVAMGGNRRYLRRSHK